MTIAICMNCGAEKFGAFNPCDKCGFAPITEEELAYSMAIIDRHFDHPSLKRIGDQIRAGKRPDLDPEMREAMIDAVRKCGIMTMMGLQTDRPVRPKKKRGVLSKLFRSS